MARKTNAVKWRGMYDVAVAASVGWWLQAIRYVVNQMDRYLLAQREYRTGCVVRIKHFIAKLCCLVGGKLYGNYLISGYMAVKLLYVANAVGQQLLQLLQLPQRQRQQ